MPIYDLRYISSDHLSGAISSSFKYVPSNPREIEQRGELYGLITVIGGDGVQADRISKFVWDSIIDSYFYSPFSSVIDALKNAVSQGSKKASDLIKNDQGVEVNLSFALAVFKGKGAYLTVYGEQELFMYKNGGIVKISDVITQNKGVVVSVAWSENDILLMGSPNLLSSLVESISLGDDNEEVVRNVEASAYNLSGYQSILLLSGKEQKRKKIDPLILQPVPNIKTERAEESAVDNENLESKENVKEFVLEDDIEKQKINSKSRLFKNINFDFGKVKTILKKIGSKVKLVVTKVLPFLDVLTSKIGNLFSLVFGKIRDSFRGLYGNKHWYRSMMSKLSFSSFGKGSIKIDGYKETGLRNKRFGILFLLVILGVLIFFGVRLSMNAKVARDIHKEVSVEMDALDKSLDLAQKNLLTDPDTVALELFDMTEPIANLASKQLSIDDSKRYADIQKRYTELDDKLNHRVGLSEESGNIEGFLDGRAEFGPTADISDITFYMDEFQNSFLLVVDKGDGVVYKVNLSTKKIEKVSDSKNILKKPQYIDYGVGGIYVYDESRGVLKATFGKNGAIGNFAPVAGLDKDVIGDISVEDFAIITSNDNVYFLSRSEKAILKANKSGGGYSLPYDFITSKTFSKAYNLANDVNIFALTQGEKGIERYAYNYTKGKTTLVPVTTVGLVPDFGDIVAGYTGSLSNSNLFVFDKTNSRLVVLEKPIESGQDSRHPNQMVVTNQFVYRGSRNDVFKDVKEVAADYNDEFSYILDGNQIWKIKVK